MDLKIENWSITRLVAYGKNPRKNDAQVDRMVAAIDEFGFRIPIVAKSNGTVVDGHLRLKAALKMGIKTVPVALADDLTEEQVKAFRILANKSANWAQFDIELLAVELSDLEASGMDVLMTGFSEGEIDEIKSMAMMTMQIPSGQDIFGEGLGKGRLKIRVVLPPGCVEILEKAIQKTGECNRAEAVKKICEVYLGEERQ